MTCMKGASVMALSLCSPSFFSSASSKKIRPHAFARGLIDCCSYFVLGDVVLGVVVLPEVLLPMLPDVPPEGAHAAPATATNAAATAAAIVLTITIEISMEC